MFRKAVLHNSFVLVQELKEARKDLAAKGITF